MVEWQTLFKHHKWYQEIYFLDYSYICEMWFWLMNIYILYSVFLRHDGTFSYRYISGYICYHRLGAGEMLKVHNNPLSHITHGCSPFLQANNAIINYYTEPSPWHNWLLEMASKFVTFDKIILKYEMKRKVKAIYSTGNVLPALTQVRLGLPVLVVGICQLLFH